MTPADWLLLGAILFLIFCSGFFSGSETALTAVTRARLHSLEQNGDKRAGVVQKLIEKKDRLISTLLIGNNLVNILASALATSFFLRVIGDAGIFVATFAMTVIVVIFADSALRYITKCFSDKWMTAHGFKLEEVEKV